ncbi:MAG: SDR family NAD(P)-dependent oxidoreductase, partial [Planctomycetota bacterium]
MVELALVTGGETGIGLAVARALEGGGFEVRTASRRSGCDLLARGAIERLVASLPRLDVLVNNAGIAESAPLAKTTDSMWDRHFAIN